MKKVLTILLMVVMVISLVACAPKEGEKPPVTNAKPGETSVKPGETEAPVTGVAKFDWTAFDKLIAEIKSTNDLEARVGLMHEAEDMLMETGALCPIYHYNDNYMAKTELKDYYTTAYAYKYFESATFGDKDTLNLCIASEPQYIDPTLNSSVDGAVMTVNSFSGLVTYNKAGELVPDCAEKIDISDDGMTYVFTMRDGLKWSNGEKLDAGDFEYSLKRAANPEVGADYRYMLDCIEGWPEDDTEDFEKLAVTASADGKTLTIKLKAVTAYFLDLCAFPTYFPVNQENVESAEGYLGADGKIKDPAAWTQNGGYVSNGPFMNTSWEHKASMTFERNPYFHRAENVKLEKLHFLLSDDDTTIFSAYKAGDLDFIDNVPPDEIKELLATNNPEFHIVDNLGTYFVIFNVKSEMFEGKTVEQAHKIRRAVSMAIDRQYIVDTVGQTGQRLANSFIPPTMLDGTGKEFKQNTAKYTYPDEASAGYFPYEQDLDLARQLLTEAGYEFGDDGKLSATTPLHINYILNTNAGHAAVAQIIYDDLAELGITMEISQMDWDTTLAERKAGNFDVARHGWIADFNDPINMLEMWETSSGNNDAQFGR